MKTTLDPHNWVPSFSRRARTITTSLVVGCVFFSCTEGPEGDDDGAELAPTLREVARSAGVRIGAAVSVTALRDDPQYAEILAREFGSVTPENATKWEPLAPSAGGYNWEDADAIVEFAEEHDQMIKGHTFVWHRQTPRWLTSTMTAEEVSVALKNHIEMTLSRYRGRIFAWDVVNEAVDISTNSGYTESIFWEKLGPEYIADAFRWARAADPDVLLYYNEVAIERAGTKSDFTYQMIKELLDDGVPIDGIGFQSHISTHRYPSMGDLRDNIRRFADLGLKVSLSEVDARTKILPGTTEDRWFAQRVSFQQLVSACVAEPGCDEVTFWGFTDRYSWINDEGEEDPLLFDRNYQKKPAYEGVMDGLAGILPSEGENVVQNSKFNSEESWEAAGGTLVFDTEAGEACVSDRAGTSFGLVQADLVDALLAGGPFAFEAQVRAAGAPVGSFDASILIEDESGSLESNIATRPIDGSGWTTLSGYLALGYESLPSSLGLKLSGPPEGEELCVRSVELRPLSP